MVDQPVDRRRRGHRVFEDLFPFREREVAGEHDASALVPLRQQREQHLHFLSRLLDVPEVVQDQDVEFRQAFDRPWEFEIPFRDQQFLDEETRWNEVDSTPLPNQFLADRAEQMRLAAPGIPESQDILPSLHKRSFK